MAKKRSKKKTSKSKKATSKKTTKKKSTKKRTTKKKSTKPTPVKIVGRSPRDKNIEKVLVQNFVSLQTIMADLSVKFDHLSKNMSRLLDLFEKSATALMEKDIKVEEIKSEDKKESEVKEVVEGLNKLLDQNKIIAKGIALLHESKTPVTSIQLPKQPSPQMPPKQQNIPSQQKQMPPQTKQIDPQTPGASIQREQDTGVYQKSISSKDKNVKK